jgi:hypothetical protein
MSKLLLGSLVVAMLALTGLVAYNTFAPTNSGCPLSAPSEDTSCCGAAPAGACCSEPKSETSCAAKEAPASAAQQSPATEPEKKDN